MKCWKCGAEVIGRNREGCLNCQELGSRYNAQPCHRMDPHVCVLANGHTGECDDDEALMQFISGGDGGRYV